MAEQIPGYRELERRLLEPQGKTIRLALPDVAMPFVIAALHRELDLPILVIVSQSEDAKRMYDELKAWCPRSAQLQLFPEAEFMTGECNRFDVLTTAERLKTLWTLSVSCNTPGGGGSPLVVSSASAVVSKTISRNDFVASCHAVEIGMNIEPSQLVEKWQTMGYELEAIVEVPGTVSRRGGIVDVFSPNSEFPARIEFVGNKIESIRLFDEKTQRSLKLVDSVMVVPAKENRGDSDTILSYLPDEALLITDDFDELRAVIDKLCSDAEEFRLGRGEGGQPVADLPACYLTWAEFEDRIKRVRRHLTLGSWNVNVSDCDDAWVQSLPFVSVPSFGGRVEIFGERIKEMLAGNWRIVVVSQQTDRLAELLQEWDIMFCSVSRIEQLPPLGTVTLVQGSLAGGWAVEGALTLFTDSEVFGFVKQRRWFRKRPIRHHWFISELMPGDYVVHIEHGIARFAGLTKMSTDGIVREYLVLDYADNDRLYVPTDMVDRVSRYIGAGDQLPTLSRLGTQEWARTKQRIKESVADVARELLNLYAAREVIPGFAFSSDNLWQQELESSFPYVETPDQLEAVEDVKRDMEKPRPMDRLVCGDVGYGKTEVALRAAFKAVMDGKQVAMLVPTTVLAQQHFMTFRERLQAFPVRVEMLSRFCNDKEQDSIIEGLAAGTVDICIGTHRLLQKDVKFKDLGLLIIDEEQRFGVVHKEHFKKLRREIDVLTLSATPIPRTLHMSLAGIRDMSIIETPPEERLPIRTYVGFFDERLVREAILRELERNGQVFFVHNRVSSIAHVADRLCALVPEAKISVAHGQMPEDELEKVMIEFVNRSSDVLVTTTIIESGLDMPNVNTLIVDQADKLGLTQLYQLRGRIGRGSNTAYAYFLFDKGKQLTPEACKRLRTISEATELGAGFGIAIKDLEIRGAGNLLGLEQSGHIAAVGFDLYCRLLAEAVDELRQVRLGGDKRKQLQPPRFPAIDLPFSAYIPEEYISSLSTRLSFYHRLAVAKQASDLEEISLELVDRFGPLPVPVENLLYVVRIRQLASETMVESIFTENKEIVLQFNSVKRLSCLSLPRYSADGVTLGARQIRLDMECFGNDWQEALRRVLQELAARQS